MDDTKLAWEEWFLELKQIAEKHEFNEAGVMNSFDNNQECWRELYDDGLDPADAYDVGMDIA